MTKTDDEIEAQQAAVGLLPLLKEYNDKLHLMSKEIRGFQDLAEKAMLAEDTKGVDKTQVFSRLTNEMDLLRRRFHRIYPAANHLIQQASQFFQHAKIDIATRIELALRTAEFEAELHELMQTVNTRF